jgi:hypothetical protein
VGKGGIILYLPSILLNGRRRLLADLLRTLAIIADGIALAPLLPLPTALARPAGAFAGTRTADIIVVHAARALGGGGGGGGTTKGIPNRRSSDDG